MLSFKVFYLFLVSVLLGANTTLLTTPYEIGPGRITRDFTSAYGRSATAYHVIDLPILAPVTRTGGTVTSTGPDGTAGVKYAAVCIPNPLKKMGTGTGRTFLNRGSGSIAYAVYKNVSNPAAVGGDLGFVKACDAGTGSTIMDNISTVTGAVVRYTTGTAVWNDADYLKLGLRGDPTAGYRATLFIMVRE